MRSGCRRAPRSSSPRATTCSSTTGPGRPCADLLDEVWAVDVDPDVRLARLVARHVEFGKPPERAAAWVESVDVPNATFVRSTFDRADLVVRAT